MRHNGTRYDAGRRSRDNPSGGPGGKLATSQFQLARRKSLGIRWASGSIPIARSSYPFPSNNLAICQAAKGGNKK